MTNTMALLATLSDPDTESTKKEEATAELEALLHKERVTVAHHVRSVFTIFVNRFLASKGVDNEEPFVDIDSVVYHDVTGWRVALLVAFIQGSHNHVDDLEESLMDRILAELDRRGISTIVNDVCVNHVQHHRNKIQTDIVV